jgi:hypothetical protein
MICTMAIRECGGVAKRSEAMQNVPALEVHYTDYRRQMAWINENDWQIEQRAKRYPVRQAVAKVLIALATRLMPPTPRRTRVA